MGSRGNDRKPIMGATFTLMVPERTINFFSRVTRGQVGSVSGTDVPDLWLVGEDGSGVM
jgi:hypothetical protein